MKHLKTFEGAFEDVDMSAIVGDELQELAIQMVIDSDVNNMTIENANDLMVHGSGSELVVELDWLDEGEDEYRVNVQLSVESGGSGRVGITCENQDNGALEDQNYEVNELEINEDVIEAIDEAIGSGMMMSRGMQQSAENYSSESEYGEYSEDEEFVRQKPGYGGQNRSDRAVAGDMY